MPGEHSVHSRGTEPPAPPCHLFSISVDDPILSVPRKVPEKPTRRGGHLEIYQKLLPRVQIGLPSNRHISDTWWLIQDTDGSSSSPPWGRFSKIKDFQLEEPGAMCMVSSPVGPKGHRAIVALSWEGGVGAGGSFHHG